MSIIYLTLLCAFALLMLAALLEAVMSVSRKPVWQEQRLTAFGAPQAGHSQALAPEVGIATTGLPTPEEKTARPASTPTPELAPENVTARTTLAGSRPAAAPVTVSQEVVSAAVA